MTTEAPVSPRLAPRATVLTVASVLVVAVSLTWTYLSMRAVMNVGGACAEGGPYVIETPCPDGSMLIAIAIPALIIFAMVGTVTASSVGAPNLLVPMWGVLFGTLGWNFLEYSFKGADIVWGWLVCGVMFWVMALPAFVFMLTQLRETRRGAAVWWLPAYGVLGAVGLLLGWWSFVAVAS